MPRINVEDLAMVIPIGVTESNNKANELQLYRSLLYPATLSIVTSTYIYCLRVFASRAFRWNVVLDFFRFYSAYSARRLARVLWRSALHIQWMEKTLSDLSWSRDSCVHWGSGLVWGTFTFSVRPPLLPPPDAFTPCRCMCRLMRFFHSLSLCVRSLTHSLCVLICVRVRALV